MLSVSPTRRPLTDVMLVDVKCIPNLKSNSIVSFSSAFHPLHSSNYYDLANTCLWGRGQWCRAEGHCFGGKQEVWRCSMWNARKVKCCFQAGGELHLLQQNEGEDYSSSRVGPAFVKKDSKPPGLTLEYHEGCLVACKTGLGTPVEDERFNG